MKIHILYDEKIKSKFLDEYIKEYSKRLKRFINVNLNSFNKNDLCLLKESSYVFLVDNPSLKETKDKLMDSILFSKTIEEILSKSFKDIFFIISSEKLDFKHEVIKISKMTLTNEMLIAILFEQIYRAYKINRNEKYHK